MQITNIVLANDEPKDYSNLWKFVIINEWYLENMVSLKQRTINIWQTCGSLAIINGIKCHGMANYDKFWNYLFKKSDHGRMHLASTVIINGLIAVGNQITTEDSYIQLKYETRF